jgi:hypothetical protein
MLSPEYMAGLPRELVDVYTNLEDTIIKDIARRLKKAGATVTAEWQRTRLQELGAGTKYINKEIAAAMQTSEEVVEKLFRESSDVYMDNQAEIFEAVGIKPDSAYIEQLTTAAVAQAKGELSNFTQTMGFPMKNGQFSMWTDAYRNALDLAQFQVASGAMDYNTAIRRALKQFTDNGICTIGYLSGRTYTIEAAARMCVLNGVSDLSIKIAEKNAEDLGTDGWEITAHADCAPDHEPIQGRQYTKKEYEALNNSLARQIGTLGCRHSAFPVLLGISERAYTPEELQEFERANAEGVTYEGRHYTGYQATQMQRKIERAIRKTKRELIGYDESGLKDEFTAGSIKLRRLRTYYSDFSSKAGLLTQNERTQVSGYGRSMSGKVLLAEVKAKQLFAEQHIASVDSLMLKSNSRSGIISAYKFSSRDAADRLLRPQTERFWKKLSDHERQSAYKYTAGSGGFNRPLRGYAGSWSNFKGIGNVSLNNEGMEQSISGLKSAIDKSRIQNNMWLFRGSDKQSLSGMLGVEESKLIPSNAERLNKKFSGVPVKDNGFFSTGIAADAGFNNTINYEILAPKGTKGIYAEPFSAFGGTNSTGTWDGIEKGTFIDSEAEMILQAGTEFEIKSITTIGGKLTVVMEVIR